MGEGCLECLLGALSERKLVCQGWERWGRGVWNVYWVHCLKGNLSVRGGKGGGGVFGMFTGCII